MSFVQDDICCECECSHVGDKKVEFAELGHCLRQALTP